MERTKNLSRRFLQAIKKVGLSRYAAAKEMGTSDSVLSKINQGRTPSAELLERFSVMYPQINARWLLTGEGEMLQNEDKNVTPTVTPTVTPKLKIQRGAEERGERLEGNENNEAVEVQVLGGRLFLNVAELTKELRLEVEQLRAELLEIKSQIDQDKPGADPIK